MSKEQGVIFFFLLPNPRILFLRPSNSFMIIIIININNNKKKLKMPQNASKSFLSGCITSVPSLFCKMFFFIYYSNVFLPQT